jgi:WD40 repeat protein
VAFSIFSLAVAELDGRPVVISGSDDRTVRVWHLATGAPVGDPFTSRGAPVNAVTSQTRRGFIPTGSPADIFAGSLHQPNCCFPPGNLWDGM